MSSRWITGAVAGVSMSGLAFVGAEMIALGQHNLGLGALALMAAMLVFTSLVRC